MLSDKEYIRAWQGRVGSRTVHLNPESFEPVGIQYLTSQYSLVTENINVNERSVIVDYGCGGGLFGVYLFNWEYNPKKYIAIDIANRCVNEARLNTMCWEQENKKTITEVIEINPVQLFDFTLLRANIFVMLNVVRYFPDIEYVNMFFDRLNKSKIKTIIFNFRKGDKNSFSKTPYKTTKDIGNANILTTETIINLMNNYQIEKTKILSKDDCFLFLKKKRKKINMDKEN